MTSLTSEVPVDLFIKNGLVVTMDDRLNIYHPGALAIGGDSIVAVGREEDLAPLALKAKEVLDAGGGAVLPGLINTHTHAAMTLLRGLADDLPLMDWLENHIFPAERQMTGEWVYWGTLLACAEMILSGTTTFCDMYLFEAEAARAAREAGMRALVGEVLYDFPSPNYGPLEKGFEYTRDLIRQYRDDPLISVAVEPHTPFTCAPELLLRAKGLSAETGAPLIIHLAETRTEAEQILKRYGVSPTQHLACLGLLDEHLIAVHCVVLSAADRNTLAAAGVKVAHCPESNMKLASGVAPVVELLRRGVSVGLGTDGCASNNNLDLFQEMDSAAKLHKVHLLDPTVMDARTVFRMATRGGARVLGLESRVGSLEAGKKADLLILNLDQPHLTPLYNIYSHLVYAARGADVTRVIINGRTVMKDRELVTLDLKEILFRANQFAEMLRRARRNR
jgi:5-methylthioadenosine/S-adenosylhomocysteine deaminase